MTIDEIVVNVSPGEIRAGFLASGDLIRLVVDRGGQNLRVGDIAVGRVTKVLPAIDAAFVNIGESRAGFLGLAEVRPVDRSGGRIGDFIGEGDRVLVQVIREAEGEKGPKLTARPSLLAFARSSSPMNPDAGCPGASKSSSMQTVKTRCGAHCPPTPAAGSFGVPRQKRTCRR